MNAEQIAHVCHEANRALQIEHADPTIPTSPSWNYLDPETRDSTVQGVQGVLDGNTPQESHDQWVAFKIDNGWTLGPVKDLGLKLHPLLVPYDELPHSQQLKDHLFVAIVDVLA